MSSAAETFLDQFLSNRKVNVEFYKRVPEDKLDFRMVDTPQRKSDSPRESIIHQIDTSLDYINGVKNGELKFGVEYPDLENLTNASKEELLTKLDETETIIKELLQDPGIDDKKVKVPWSEEPIPAIAALYGLDSHEVLHQGWNLAIMDHLNIERFPELKEMWG